AANDIVHYDFTPANVLLSGDRVTGVVDWEGTRRGDRAFDLATFLFYTGHEPALRKRLLDELRAIRPSTVVATYVAHIAVRQLDFSIRHHSAEAVAHWLARMNSWWAHV